MFYIFYSFYSSSGCRLLVAAAADWVLWVLVSPHNTTLLFLKGGKKNDRFVLRVTITTTTRLPHTYPVKLFCKGLAFPLFSAG